MSDEITSDIASVSTGTPESLAALRMKWQLRAQRARENLALVDSAILEHMEAAGVTRLLVSDSLELRAVTDKTTKCVSNEETADAVFTAVAGDIRRFCECLAAGAFKPGTTRRVLPPQDFDRLFETVVKMRLEGKAVRKLAIVNPKMIPAGASQHDNDD